MRLAPLPLVLACALGAVSCGSSDDQSAGLPPAEDPAPNAEKAATPAADRPNVLFIVVDDLNDWVGALGGHPQARTPNIDALAARGMLFTNAHGAAPACNPSRTAVLTGLRPTTSGVYRNSQPWWKSLLSDPSITFVRDERNRILHEAPPKIGQKLHAGTQPPRASSCYFYETDVSATDTVRKHLERTVEILAEGEDRFR